MQWTRIWWVRPVSKINSTKLEFDKETHTYIKDGIILTSVTQLLQELFPLKYENVPKEILNQKAEYGKSVIKKLSKKLVSEYGRGYGERNIFRMLKFYDYFPDFEILSTLSTKLSWSHFVELLQIPEKLKRDFYATMCSNEFWGVRTLRERIGSALFERTAISKKPEQTIINGFLK